jgi:hypothetical protein
LALASAITTPSMLEITKPALRVLPSVHRLQSLQLRHA